MASHATKLHAVVYPKPSLTPQSGSIINLHTVCISQPHTLAHPTQPPHVPRHPTPARPVHTSFTPTHTAHSIKPHTHPCTPQSTHNTPHHQAPHSPLYIPGTTKSVCAGTVLDEGAVINVRSMCVCHPLQTATSHPPTLLRPGERGAATPSPPA